MAKRRKKATPAQRTLRIAWPIVLWALFVWWYTNTGGPLSDVEIDNFLTAMEERGTDPERRELLREFLANDTGDDFVMLNLMELNTVVRDLPDATPNGEETSTGAEVLDRYMAHMWPALLTRACHPVNVGTAAAEALDLWGIDGARTWSQGAMMRYRSRRDLVEISSNPDFQGPHEYKILAMNKTIAIPLDPWVNTGDPRLLLGLIALILVLIGARR